MNQSRISLFNEFTGFCMKQMVDLSRQSWLGRQTCHTANHVQHVYSGARRIVECQVGRYGYTDEIDQLVYAASAAHDLIQAAKTDVGKFGFDVRVRDRGPNEDRTADLARDTLVALRGRYGEDAISVDEILRVWIAISYTFPAWDAQLGTMVQPRLQKALDCGDWHPVPVAVAMGDLVLCGHHTNSFMIMSDALFVEEQVGIDKMLHLDHIGEKTMNGDEEARALEAMRAWDKSQGSFVEGAEKAFRAKLKYFPEAARRTLEKRINRFGDSLAAIRLRCAHRASLNARQYAMTMGFERVKLSD